MARYSTISGIKLTEDNLSILTLSAGYGLFVPLSLLGVLATFWLFLVYESAIQGSFVVGGIIITAIMALLALLAVTLVTMRATVSLNNLSHTLTVSREHLLGFGRWPRIRQYEYAFSEIASVFYRISFRSHYVEVITKGNDRLTLMFGTRSDQAARTAQVTAGWLNIPQQAVEPISLSAIPSLPADAVAYMYREIRSWASWSILLGVLHLIANGTLSPAWGIVLIIVGLISFYFRDAAMFAIYGVTLGWVAISNLISSGLGLWSVFALFQMYLSYRVFRQFFTFKKAQAALLLPGTEPAFTQASRVFPWAGFALGVLAFNGVILAIVGIFVAAILKLALINALTLLLDISVHTAILGVAFAVAALLSGFNHKAFATIGLICGILVVIAQVILVLL